LIYSSWIWSWTWVYFDQVDFYSLLKRLTILIFEFGLYTKLKISICDFEAVYMCIPNISYPTSFHMKLNILRKDNFTHTSWSTQSRTNTIYFTLISFLCSITHPSHDTTYHRMTSSDMEFRICRWIKSGRLNTGCKLLKEH
jgi:hypothetical protein